MSKKKISFILSAIVIAVLAFGFLFPLGSYTTQKGCPAQPTPDERLHFIMGDSLESIKANDVEPGPNEGCSVNTKYTVYLF